MNLVPADPTGLIDAVPPWTCHDGAGNWYRIIDPEHVRLRGGLAPGEHAAVAQAVTDSDGNALGRLMIELLGGDVLSIHNTRYPVLDLTRDADDGGAWVTLRLGPPLTD